MVCGGGGGMSEKVQWISAAKAYEIASTMDPIGRFIHHDILHEVYVAIDNSTGDAWVEEFKYYEDAVKWLSGQVKTPTA